MNFKKYLLFSLFLILSTQPLLCIDSVASNSTEKFCKWVCKWTSDSYTKYCTQDKMFKPVIGLALGLGTYLAWQSIHNHYQIQAQKSLMLFSALSGLKKADAASKKTSLATRALERGGWRITNMIFGKNKLSEAVEKYCDQVGKGEDSEAKNTLAIIHSYLLSGGWGNFILE